MTALAQQTWTRPDHGTPAVVRSHIIAGIEAAGGHLLTWLYGGPDRTRQLISHSLERPDSEFWLHRALLLTGRSAEPVGGFIAMPGSVLTRCRMADARFLVAFMAPAERQRLLRRLRHLLAVPHVQADEYYLSKLWVDEQHRERGHGRRLLRRCLAEGRLAGSLTCRLEVCSTNRAAHALYRSMGFEETATFTVEPLGTRHIVMARRLDK